MWVLGGSQTYCAQVKGGEDELVYSFMHQIETETVPKGLALSVFIISSAAISVGKHNLNTAEICLLMEDDMVY